MTSKFGFDGKTVPLSSSARANDKGKSPPPVFKFPPPSTVEVKKDNYPHNSIERVANIGLIPTKNVTVNDDPLNLKSPSHFATR